MFHFSLHNFNFASVQVEVSKPVSKIHKKASPQIEEAVCLGNFADLLTGKND
jgi:hypothetical protein